MSEASEERREAKRSEAKRSEAKRSEAKREECQLDIGGEKERSDDRWHEHR